MRKSNFESFIRFGGSRALVLKPFGSPHLERKQDSQGAEGAVVEWIPDVWSSHYGAVVESILKTRPFEFSPAKLANLDQESLRVDAEMVVLAAMEAGGFDLSSAEGERRAVMVLTNFLNQALQEAIGIEFYVWVTSRDARVRESHAEREGTIFRWDSPPEGGHPSHDFGCRCYARPLGIEGYWQRVKPSVDAFTNDLPSLEGSIDHMYLDSADNVTVGRGKLLATADAAAALGFRHRDPNKAATEEEIRAEYAVIDDLVGSPKIAAEYYRDFTTLYLPPSEINQLVLDHMRGDFDDLLRMFPEFDNYPLSAQIALWDLIYNLGPKGLRDEFPKMRQAIRESDWEGAASESERGDVGIERNQYVFDLFMRAAEED